MSSHQAQTKGARELEKEQKEKLGAVVYPWETLRIRLKRIKPIVRMGSIEPAPETCAVSDLEEKCILLKKMLD